MDNSALKAAAQKELMRRAAKAELERRAQLQKAPNTQDHTAQVQSQYDAMPWYQKAGTAVQDMALIGADTLSGGFSDKGAAYLQSKLDGKSYDDTLAGYRQKTNDARSRAGTAASAADILALASPASAIGKIAKGANIAADAPRAVKFGLGLLGSAGASGTYGAYSAAGHDESVPEGMAYGAAGGVGGALLGHAAGSLAQSVGAKLKNMGLGTREQAVNKVLALAESMGITHASASQKMAELGPDAMLADLLGKKGQALGRAAGNVSADARGILEAATSARKAGQNERIVGALEQASGLPLGNRKGVETLKQDYNSKAMPVINRAYNAVRDAGGDLPRTPFEHILNSPMGKDAYEEAAKSLLNRAAATGETYASEAARLDMTKRILDAKATAAFRAGRNDIGGEAQGLSKALREQLDNLIPEYANARGLRKTAYQVENAFDQGQSLAGGRIPLGLPNIASKLEEPLKKYQAQGYGAQQAENLLNKGNTEHAINALSTTSAKEAAQAALGKSYPMLEKRLAGERTFNQTHKGFTGNSTTAQQLIDAGAGGLLGIGGAYATGQDLKSGGITGALLGAGRRYGPAAVSKFALAKTKAIAPEIADILTTRALPKSVTPTTRLSLLGQSIETLSKSKKKALITALTTGGTLLGSR